MALSFAIVSAVVILSIFVPLAKASEGTVQVECKTTQGYIAMDIHRDWSPRGADRFLELVRDGFYTDIALYRAVEGFLVQFGISDKPEYQHWHEDNIPDDKNLNLGIKKNYISFAGGGPNTRSTQLFIAFEDLDFLGKEPWETPFGVVWYGQETLDNIYKGYGEMVPFGNGPDQQEIYRQGNDYIRENFPLIDFIERCEVLDDLDADVSSREDNRDRDQEV
jgi:cyclophilin family peptidyl-prolyl cis-trans isomerase